MNDEKWPTAITEVKPNRIMTRGYPIDELMGRISFAQAIYLVLKGDLPSPEVGRLLDAIFVSSVDHGASPPSVLVARTVASTGSELNAAIAAGVNTARAVTVAYMLAGACSAVSGVLLAARYGSGDMELGTGYD